MVLDRITGRKEGKGREETTDITDRTGRASYFTDSHPCYLCNPWFDLAVSANDRSGTRQTKARKQVSWPLSRSSCYPVKNICPSILRERLLPDHVSPERPVSVQRLPTSLLDGNKRRDFHRKGLRTFAGPPCHFISTLSYQKSVRPFRAPCVLLPRSACACGIGRG